MHLNSGGRNPTVNTVQGDRQGEGADCVQRSGVEGPAGEVALQDEGRKTPYGHRDCWQQEQTLALVSCRGAAHMAWESRGDRPRSW